MSTIPKTRERSAALIPYLPRTILSWYEENESCGAHAVSPMHGTLVCIDLSGFTALTRHLATQGKVGQEKLTEILNAAFGKLNAIVEWHDGEILKFAGDALWVNFEAEVRIGSIRGKAVEAIAEINQDFREDLYEELAVHIGAAKGNYWLASLGSEANRLEAEPVGDLVATVFAACDSAGKNEFVIAPEGSRVDGVTFGSYDSGEQTRKASHVNDPTRISESAYLEKYVPIELLDRLNSDGGTVQSEHRSVAILFALVQFAGDVGQNGPDRAELNQSIQRLFNLVREYNGTIARMDPYGAGHKLLVLFGAPQRHEDDDSRSVSCALEMVKLSQPRFNIRIGLAHGPVLCGDVGSSARREYTVMGEAINLAARLMAKGKDGQILADNSIRARLADTVVCETIELSLKGITGIVTANRIIGTQENHETKKQICQSRYWGKEVVDLLGQWELVKSGSQAFVSVFGEPGTGKTTFVNEFARELGASATQIECRAAILYGRGWVARKVLQELAKRKGIPDLTVWALSLIESRWHSVLSDFLENGHTESEWTKGLTKELRKEKRDELFAELIRALVRDPQAVILDDFDRADALSHELILGFRKLSTSLPLLIVTTQRDASSNNSHENASAQSSTLRLEPPDRGTWQQFFEERFDNGKREREFLERVLSTTGGNPGFVWEVIRGALLNNAMVQNSFSGKWQLLHSSSEVAIPITLAQSFLSRFDRLDENQRSLLKGMSIQGWGIPAEFVTRFVLITSEGEKSDVLSSLVELELVQLDLSQNVSFVQPGMGEAIYDCLPRSRALEWHKEFAEYLLEHGEATDDLLGYHFLEGEIFDKAFHYVISALRRDLASFALLDAAQQIGRGLRILNRHSDDEQAAIQFEFLQAKFLDLEGQGKDCLAVLRSIRRRAKRLQSREDLCRAAIEAARQMWKLSRYRHGQNMLRLILGSRELTQFPGLESEAHLVLAEIYRRTGKFQQAEEHARRGVTIAISISDAERIADGCNRLGLSLWGQGRLPEAKQQFEACTESMVARESRYLWARGVNNLGIVNWELGHLQKAMELMQMSAEAMDDLGDRRNAAYSSGNMAGIAKVLGQYAGAEQLYLRADDTFLRLGDEHAHFYTIGNLGDLAILRGTLGEARDKFADTMAFAVKAGDKELIAECEIRSGELAFYGGEVSSAAEQFDLAIGHAAEIGSDEFHLRGLICLARVKVAQQLPDDVRELADKIMTLAKKSTSRIPYLESTFLTAESFKLTESLDETIPLYLEVMNEAVEAGIFELELKSACRLVETSLKDTSTASELIRKLAEQFDVQNGAGAFVTVLEAPYFNFFASTALGVIGKREVVPHA